jgi:hypothetical protein
MDAAPASWLCYFQDEFQADDRRVRLIESLSDFFGQPSGWEFLSRLQVGLHPCLVLPVDFSRLCAQCGLADLEQAMRYQPLECIRCMGAAAYEVRLLSLCKVRCAGCKSAPLLPAIQCNLKMIYDLINMCKTVCFVCLALQSVVVSARPGKRADGTDTAVCSHVKNAS